MQGFFISQAEDESGPAACFDVDDEMRSLWLVPEGVVHLCLFMDDNGFVYSDEIKESQPLTCQTGA